MAMTTEEPKVRPDGRYSVKETCQALGISRETLRRYTNAGAIIVKHRRVNMRPFYTGANILSLWRATMV